MALVSIAELMPPMGHIQGAHRHEEIECPPRLDEYLAVENQVRFIDAFVDEIDLATLGFRHVTAAATGRPSDQLGDLLKLYIYGYLYRVRSSQRLEQETQRHVELMWLLKKLRPDHTTIANFRRDHLTPRRDVCRTFTLLCKKLDLFGGELVAIDGSQFRAVNAKERHVTKAKLARVIATLMRGWKTISKSWRPLMIQTKQGLRVEHALPVSSPRSRRGESGGCATRTCRRSWKAVGKTSAR